MVEAIVEPQGLDAIGGDISSAASMDKSVTSEASTMIGWFECCCSKSIVDLSSSQEASSALTMMCGILSPNAFGASLKF